MNWMIAGIDTDVGKTIISAILVEILHADYWKPLQTGQELDSTTIRRLITRENLVCHPEAYCLQYPASPHFAAHLEGVVIAPEKIIPPTTPNHLVIEMAGGLFSPLNDDLTQCDLYSQWNCQWILVVKNYLGSINHTLLTLACMKEKKLPLAGIIFNGENNASSEEFILNYSGIPCLGRIDNESEMNPSVIQKYKEKWKQNFPI